MELSSGELLGLLCVVAVASLAGVVWLWPKVAAPKVVHLLSRVGLLLFCQVTIVLALTAGMNKYFLFYATWDDLLGGDSGAVRIGSSNVPSGGNPTSQAIKKVANKFLPHSSKHHDPAKHGQIDQLDITGVRTGLRTEAYVYLPPEYFRLPHKRLPVVILIAGYPAADKLTWMSKGHVPDDAIKEAAAGRIQPTIYVMMRPTVVTGRDTECSDVPGGPQVESFFAQDVPDALSAAYANRLPLKRTGWALGGYSTGGYCAAKLAMLHSDKFIAAASMAGHFDALQDATTGELYGGSKAVRNQNNLLWRLQHLPPPPTSILVASSEVGEKTWHQAQRFVALVRPPMAVETALLPTGGHNFKTFRRYIVPSMQWLSRHMIAE